MKDIQIIEYNDAYRNSVIDLLGKAFPGSGHEQNFSWRFDNRGQDKPIMVCAIDSGKVISFNSWIKWLFTWEGKTFVGYQSGESATDNNYRRMGIWGKLINLGEQIAKDFGYIDFFFGFPAEISFGGFIKAGYCHVGTYNRHVRLINPLSFNTHETNQDTSRNPATIFLSQRNKVSPIVDMNYIDWRYHRNPHKYKFINYYENGNISTFVLKQRRYYNRKYRINFSEVQILDCNFTTYDKNFIYNSFRYIDGIFSRKAVWISTFFNEGTDKGKALMPHFHINFKHRGGKLIFKKIKPAIDNELFCIFDNWDLQPHIVDSE